MSAFVYPPSSPSVRLERRVNLRPSRSHLRVVLACVVQGLLQLSLVVWPHRAAAHKVILVLALSLIFWFTYTLLEPLKGRVRRSVMTILVIAAMAQCGWLNWINQNLVSVTHEIALGVASLATFRTIRLLKLGPFSNLRLLAEWCTTGMVLSLSLNYILYLSVKYEAEELQWVSIPFMGGLAAILLLLWAAPLLTMATSATYRLALRADLAMRHGQFARAAGYVDRARELADQSVEQEWNRMVLGLVEGRLLARQGRWEEALAPLRRSMQHARELDLPGDAREAEFSLSECLTQLNGAVNSTSEETVSQPSLHPEQSRNPAAPVA